MHDDDLAVDRRLEPNRNPRRLARAGGCLDDYEAMRIDRIGDRLTVGFYRQICGQVTLKLSVGQVDRFANGDSLETSTVTVFIWSEEAAEPSAGTLGLWPDLFVNALL